ncbi:MAG: aminodeoxychorismate lyase [Sphingobacteriales bacterium 41-5]|nr:MAG: aminodeoxychorismate lyase [Sphingobacteriales bacterium 41-5]
MRKKTRLIIFAAIVLAGAFLLFKFLGPAARKPEKEFLYIKTGSSINDVKQQLLDEDILPSLTWFNLTDKFLKIHNIKPGKYEVKNGMSVLNLVRMIRNGRQTPVEFVVTKIRTKEQLAGRLGRAFEFDSLAAIHFLNNNDSLKKYDLDTNTVMAAVLPLTYESNWATTAQAVFEKFNTAYKKFWTEKKIQKAQQHGLSPIQAATLASIIDEETNAKKEKGTIASVYLNRIQKGMPLQADPTVKFALKDFGLKRILNSHLQVQSPYNTYKNRGLPPGPICTPQQETVEAVLDAPKTDYIYFVASTAFDGTHQFTTNYADHLKLAKAYQQELNKRFGKPQPTPGK